MSSHKLPRPARDLPRPSLKARAASLKASAARALRRGGSSASLPEPGSPEAMAAWRAACTEFDRRTCLGDDEARRLRIGETLTLWTPDKVRSAIAGDFSGATSSAEAWGMAEKSRAELQELLVLTLRRDLQFEEASRDTLIHELFALAYAEEADKPEETATESGDPILSAISEHKAAYAAWLPHLILTSEVDGADPRKAELEAAAEAPYERTKAALDGLSETMPTTVAGLIALADYLPGAVLRDGSFDDDCRALQALGAVCSAVKELAGRDAELIALGQRFDRLHAEWLVAEEANREPARRCAAAVKRAEHLEGDDYTAAMRLAWHLPGVDEAHQAKEDAFEAIEPVAEAMLALPARTPAGFAAKARALIWGQWPGGQYGETAEEDLHNDYGRRCARIFIESACAAAGVDWRGEPVSSEAFARLTYASPDAELLARAKAFTDVLLRHEAALEDFSAREDAAVSQCGHRPDDENEWPAWYPKWEAAKAAVGLDAARTEKDHLGAETQVLARQIASLPALTADGLRAKIRAISYFNPLSADEVHYPAEGLLLSLYGDAGPALPPPEPTKDL